ncbi:MAG: ATP synthase subunit I [Lachnospiraceae bacterium]
MIKRLKEMNSALPELLTGILAFGIVCELVGVWFVTDKLGFSLGLFLGVLLALGMAIHMALTLDTAVNMEQSSAEKKVRLSGIARYLIIIIVFILVMVTHIANPLAAFLGVMSLKVAAYLQPFTHRVGERLHII